VPRNAWVGNRHSDPDVLKSDLSVSPSGVIDALLGPPVVAPTDYKRHGTTTLLATLNVPEGTLIGRCMQRHRRGEFIRFLKAIERTVPPSKLIETAVDNYATHRRPKMKARFARHPRWTFHFTPTSGSWLNAVETLYWALTASASDGAAATPSTIANRHQSRSSTSLPN
jgi:DDE superfamily endonuclease